MHALPRSSSLSPQASHPKPLTPCSSPHASLPTTLTHAPCPSQLPIDERPVERLLTSIFGSVAGKIGLDERVAPRAPPQELIAALALVRLLSGHSCALTLTRAGLLRIWALGMPGAQDGVAGAPQLLQSVPLGERLGPAAVAGGGVELLGGALLAACVRGSTLSVAVGLERLHPHERVEVLIAAVDARDPRVAANALAHGWTSLAPPGAAYPHAPSGQLLRLAMLSAESATPTAPLRLTVWAYCKAGDGLGALFSREVSANGSTWQRVCCESDYELELATEDATGIVSSADAPLCSAMDWWLGRLSRPVRFASRHLEEARHALLPDAPSRRLPDAPSLRAGFEARVAQLEAAAAVSASARANFNDVEGQLGESLVHVAAQRRADPYALLAIGALAHARVGSHDGAPTTALLTTARMLLLQRAPSTVEEGIFLGIGDRVLNACGWAGGAWARRVLIPAASTAACALSAADEALDAAAALAPAALVLPQEWHALGNATAQFNACDALLRTLAQAPAPGPWAADEWARKMRERWSLSAEPAAVAAAHALAPFLNAAAAHGATRLSKLARAALVSMRLVQRQGSLAAPNLSSLMNPASRLVVAAELLHRLAVATPSTSAGLASSALEQLLRAAPLPENPGLPLSDASPCVAALLTLALRDVSIAHGDGPTVDGSSGNWPPSLASILYDAKLWRPLAAYLRVLCSPSPVHTLYAAMASLNSRRYEASAELFRLAVERCDSRANVLRGLLLAGGFAEVRSEVGQPVGEDALFDWHLFQFAAAVWRVFKAEGQDDLVVRFSQATLVELVERKATVRWHAPAQCASLATLVFSSHLALGQIKRAFEIIETLERLEKLEEREGPRGAFRERKQACLRSLISTLHSPPSLGAHKPRGALHLLASLTSHRAASLDADPMLDGNTAHGTALSLEEEVHELLISI